jgi:lipoprotein-anchoring transpeptidase ErfK/SrfK
MLAPVPARSRHFGRTRLALAGALVAVLSPAAAGVPADAKVPARAAAAPDNRVIAAGVSSAGVDLSGLTVDAASQKLLGVLVPQLNRNVVVGAGGHVFRFSPGQAKLAVDGPTSAKRAYYAGVTARGAPVSVAPAIKHDHAAVASFVASIARRIDVAARNATLQIRLTHLVVHGSRIGHALGQPGLVRAVDAAIDNPHSNRVFHVRLRITHPAINFNRLQQLDATVVTVDRNHFRLRLFKRLRIAASYPIAVGRAGLETPAGIYHVQERQVNPSWHVPNASWAGSLAGQVIPPGPNDPIVARWLGLGGGVGIHGTNEPFSIGSRASHGCIRMLVSDVIALYPRVPLGTTVYIS